MFDYVLCEGRVLAVPRSDRKVVGLMPGLCAALCGFGLFSLRVPGLPPGFLTPASESHMKADQQLRNFFVRRREFKQALVVLFCSLMEAMLCPGCRKHFSS